jgi:Holliday junction resolvase RusA-like endonuclease
VEFSFTIFGVPQPQGSMKAFLPHGWTRPVVTTDNSKLKPWRQELAQTAMITMRECGAQLAARGVPIAIELSFVFERPQSAKRTAQHKTTKPDLDKLIRAALDGFTGIIFEDDGQVSQCIATKVFGSPARLEVHVSTLAEGVPKTPKTHTLQLFENGQPTRGEIGVPKTHDFGRAG